MSVQTENLIINLANISCKRHLFSDIILCNDVLLTAIFGNYLFTLQILTTAQLLELTVNLFIFKFSVLLSDDFGIYLVKN